MITFLFPRGSIPNLFTADVRLCSAGYRKVFECGNGPCWSRSQRIQISTITTHARGPSQGPFGIWPILSLDGGTIWGSGLSSLEVVDDAWEHGTFGICMSNCVYKTAKVVNFAFISMMPRIGSHFASRICNVCKTEFTCHPPTSLGAYGSHLWGFHPQKQGLVRSFKWVWVKIDWQRSATWPKPAGPLLILEAQGLDTLTIWGSWNSTQTRIIVKQCEVWSAGEIGQSLAALIGWYFSGSSIPAGTLPVHFQHFPLFPKAQTPVVLRFPSHWWHRWGTWGAELLASFTGPELAALIEVRSSQSGDSLAVNPSGLMAIWSYLKSRYMIILHKIPVDLLVISDIISPCEAFYMK